MGHVVWQVEIDPFARAVLAKHWPCAERFSDVREVTGVHAIDCDLDGGGLNPEWIEALMGFPPGWTRTDGQLFADVSDTPPSHRESFGAHTDDATAYTPSETQSSRKSRKSSGAVMEIAKGHTT